jgi:transcription initiation factor TFIIB
MLSLNNLNQSLFDALEEYNGEQNEPEIVGKDEDFCINCETHSIQSLKGELICSSCGFFSGIKIDNGAEWRYYGSEDSKSSDPNRCGMPTNSLLPEFSLGSVIPFSRNESYNMKKIRNYNTWNNTSYRERALYQVFESMTIRAKNAGIPNCILEEAKYMYKQISETKISRGENRKGIIASCVFMACKKFDKCARSTKEIAEIFQIEPTNMTKGFKKFNEIMLLVEKKQHKDVGYSISESLDFINRFCSNLNLEGGINELCKYVCKKIEEHDLVSENTPTSKAAGSIYLVSYLFDFKISKKEISQICLTSEVTISKCFTKLIDYYIYLIPETELKYLAIDFIHKFSDNIEKFYTFEVYEDFLSSCISLFELSLKKNVIDDKKYITYLSAGVVYYQLILRSFMNINIKDICQLYHITEDIVKEFYEKIKKII